MDEITKKQIKDLKEAFSEYFELRGIDGKDTTSKPLDNLPEVYLILDKPSVVGFFFKDKALEKWFLRNFVVKSITNNFPKVNYSDVVKKEENSILLSMSYLINILNIMEILSPIVEITTKKNAPIRLENNFMLVFLANRNRDD